MKDMLSSLNVDYERFDAIRPVIDDIKFGKYKKLYERATPRLQKYADTESMHLRAVGIFGCYLSHLKVHESQIGNLEPYIILEDDILVTKETFQKLNEIIPKLESWDILRSIWESRCSISKIQGVHHESIYSKMDRPTHKLDGGTHFSVFRNAQNILDYLYEENVFNIDGVYSTCKLNVYHQKLSVGLCPLGTDIPKL